jgi:hypothetical protein
MHASGPIPDSRRNRNNGTSGSRTGETTGTGKGKESGITTGNNHTGIYVVMFFGMIAFLGINAAL